jgi:hypothetical protein
LLAFLSLAQFAIHQVKERQLARREQLLTKAYDDIQAVIHGTEQIAHRIEVDLREQQRMMNAMELRPPLTNDQAASIRTTLELPLERAP